MSEQIEDGGPAYPIDDYCNGLSIRDWFAGQALAGLLSRADAGAGQTVQEVAYGIADAMLKARAVKPEGQP